MHGLVIIRMDGYMCEQSRHGKAVSTVLIGNERTCVTEWRSIKIKPFKVSVAVIGLVLTQSQRQFPAVTGRCRLDRPIQDRPAARRD